jgi:hypothetical protein
VSDINVRLERQLGWIAAHNEVLEIHNTVLQELNKRVANLEQLARGEDQ